MAGAGSRGSKKAGRIPSSRRNGGYSPETKAAMKSQMRASNLKDFGATLQRRNKQMNAFRTVDNLRTMYAIKNNLT